MKTHAKSKHRIGPGTLKMMQYSAQCRQLSKAGKRTTSIQKILGLMGKYARSKSHFKAVRSVLRGHMIELLPRTGNEPPVQSSVEVFNRTPEGKRAKTDYLERSMELLPRAENSMSDLVIIYREVEINRKKLAVPGVDANVRMIDRFIRWSEMNTDFVGSVKSILCTERPARFVAGLARAAKPNTVRNHCAALLSFIATASSSPELMVHFKTEPRWRKKLERVADVWAKLKREQNRIARSDQRAKIRSGAFINAPITIILEFLCEVSRAYKDLISDSNTAPLMGFQAPSAFIALQAAVSCIMALHGSRLCTALNMTVGEVLDAVSVNGRYVLRIQRHKTARTSGPAAIALSPGQYRIVKCLASLKLGSEGKSATVLPKLTGRASQILFHQVNKFIADRVEGMPSMTFNLVRKTIHSNEFLIDQGKGSASDRISSYLCHGKPVVSLHYAFKSDRAVAADGALVEEVVSTLAVLDLVRSEKITLPPFNGKNIKIKQNY